MLRVKKIRTMTLDQNFRIIQDIFERAGQKNFRAPGARAARAPKLARFAVVRVARQSRAMRSPPGARLLFACWLSMFWVARYRFFFMSGVSVGRGSSVFSASFWRHPNHAPPAIINCVM